MSSQVVTMVIFGSHARGENDIDSDLDVLVVVKDNYGTLDTKTLNEQLRLELGQVPSLSVYGEGRLRKMFRSGHLFTWHLFQESMAIRNYPEIKELFGLPAAYQDAASDIRGLVNILETVPKNVARHPGNAIYEMGLNYVCARNIAMSASFALTGKHDYGRYSPFGIMDPEFPIEEAIYDAAMRARMATVRGSRAPSIGPAVVLETSEALLAWSKMIAMALEGTNRP